MWCQNCNAYIPAGADVCPNCKRPVAEVAPEEAPRQAVAPLDPSAAPPGGPAASNTPWMGRNMAGPPPTAASPYNPNMPGAQGGMYAGGVPPQYQQGAQPGAPWVGGPPREEPGVLGMTRRESLLSGVALVAGALLGYGGSTVAGGLLAPQAPVYYWATAQNDTDSIGVYKAGSPALHIIQAPAGLGSLSGMVTNRTAADYLALVANVKGVKIPGVPQFSGWALVYWTPAQLLSQFPNLRLPLLQQILPLPSGAQQVYDVRVLADQNGAGTGIVIAYTDTTPALQVAYVRLPGGTTQSLSVGPATLGGLEDISFAGPVGFGTDNTDDNVYVRIQTTSGQQTVAVSLRPAAPPAPTATTKPKPTADPTPRGTKTTGK